MKALYLLNENLELPNQSFIVKKGTKVRVNSIYNERDDAEPTIISMSFDNINGNYTINYDDFEDLLQSQQLSKIVVRYNVGDCVKVNLDEGYVQGTIKAFVGYNTFVKDYEYEVEVATKVYTDFEKNLRSC